ncbi:CsbD family protein [Sinomonas susongensis]|uniref:CsbD family protein n=1 Tax=Sinomonas susongensis TaxID=1324851 RepID=UPI0011090719|nr:CsbD family protein [Sinomonas susongensis]
MGADDKIENKAEELKGKAKEATGKVTGNESLEAEGHGDQAKAGLKQAGEHVKDSFKGKDY